MTLVLLLCGNAWLGACASSPEMVYPLGQGKIALNKSQGTPAAVDAPAHDAPEILRLSEALAELQQQITEAQTGGPFLPRKRTLTARQPNVVTPALPPTSATQPTASTPEVKVANKPLVPGVIQVSPAPDSQVFGLEPADTTMMSVLARWAGQMGWIMRLNGYGVDAQRLPKHAVAYGDVALAHGVSMAGGANAPGGQVLEAAVANLMQAHSHYQHQIAVTVGFNRDKGELEVSSHILAVTPASPSHSQHPASTGAESPLSNEASAKP